MMLDNLRKFIFDFERGFNETINLPQDYLKVKNVVIAGMGASAVPGQAIKESLVLKIPLEVSKNYTLPSFADEKTLLICVSRSGNTKETLSQLKEGLEKKCKVLIAAVEGKIKSEAENLDIPFIQIPAEFSERETREIFSYLFALILKTLKTLNLTNDSPSLSVLKAEEKNIENEAKSFVKKIEKTFPIICCQYSSVGTKWESDLSESGKHLSKSKEVPEIAHNELEAWKNLNENHSLIFLRDEKERKEIKILIEAIKKITPKEVKIFEIYGKGNNKIETVLYLVWFGGLLSYFLGKEKKVDTKKTKFIQMMKEEVKKLSS